MTQSPDVLLALTDNLTFSEQPPLLDGSPDQIAHRLVDAAHARSRPAGHPRGKIDDITAVAARITA